MRGQSCLWPLSLWGAIVVVAAPAAAIEPIDVQPLQPHFATVMFQPASSRIDIVFSVSKPVTETRRRTVTRDGLEQAESYTAVRAATEEQMATLPMVDVEVFDINGNLLDGGAISAMTLSGAATRPALLSVDGRMVDSFYRSFFRPETVILIPRLLTPQTVPPQMFLMRDFAQPRLIALGSGPSGQWSLRSVKLRTTFETDLVMSEEPSGNSVPKAIRQPRRFFEDVTQHVAHGDVSILKTDGATMTNDQVSKLLANGDVAAVVSVTGSPPSNAWKMALKNEIPIVVLPFTALPAPPAMMATPTGVPGMPTPRLSPIPGAAAPSPAGIGPASPSPRPVAAPEPRPRPTPAIADPTTPADPENAPPAPPPPARPRPALPGDDVPPVSPPARTATPPADANEPPTKPAPVPADDDPAPPAKKKSFFDD